ncbi:hypothetical protein [Candidatus Cetobacterium colombiensis]|uniref:Uncharacterized protein n=1 Tax=Candidatus Cetobacterium colombiensis TaxID=3073100 RepID=A0ABU4WC53_9FUSO|nr:hypothetical protein [Candidatus Cetobacterium colombiensis]MDX8337109.1 hypothetical protein [Candidatus Cetobacterium colombiensis]
MIKKKDDEFSGIEIIDTGAPCFLEEDIYIPEDLVKNKSLIRVDMNIVQFPIFSKNTKRKKNEITTYFFNKNRDTYITVKPSPGDLIPGEAEERIFIALMKIMKEKGMEQEFIVSASEIRDAAKIHANSYIADIKKALSRLSETSYIFKNTMYSNEMNTILKEEINTAVLEYKSLQLNEIKNKDIKKKINDKRIKEVYIIRISDHFYKNVVKRGYLVYDSNILLDINGGIARTLYMLLEKIRFEELYIKESIFALIKKIPLKYEKRSLPVTIKTLEKAFTELKSKNLIKDFRFLKETTWLEADVEIYFDKKHNELKQERFDEDNNQLKSIYNTLAVSFTEKNIEEAAPVTIVTDDMIFELLSIMPTKAKNLKSMPKTIRDSLEKYGYEKVKAAAMYLAVQKKLTSPRAYFLKILENNWADEIVIKNKLIKDNQSLSIENSSNTGVKDYGEIEKFYSSLSTKDREEIESKAYTSYIKKCGQESKIQQLAFKAGKKQIIYDYIKDNAKENLNKQNIYIEEAEVIIPKEDVVLKNQEENKLNEVLTDIVKFNEYIDKNIEIYKIGLKLSEDEVLRIKKNILIELTLKFMTSQLSLSDINNSVIKNLS